MEAAVTGAFNTLFAEVWSKIAPNLAALSPKTPLKVMSPLLVMTVRLRAATASLPLRLWLKVTAEPFSVVCDINTTGLL